MSYIRRGLLPSFYLPRIVPVLGTVLFLLSLVLNTWTLSARAIAPGVTKETQAQATAQSSGAPVDEAASGVITTAATTNNTTSSPEVVRCSSSRSYRDPAIVDLTTAPNGLTTSVSKPYTYMVSAASLGGLRRGIAACPVRAQVAGNYHAITARQVAWSYGFSQAGTQCTLVNVKVGLSITQLLPDFAPAAGTPQSVIDTWNAYHANLVTHENGHVDVAKRYAAELVAKLNALGTRDCGALQTLAKNTVDTQLNALNATDTDYDATTGHGATQGAVL